MEDANSPNCDFIALVVNPSIVSTGTILNYAYNSNFNLKADGSTLSYTGIDANYVSVSSSCYASATNWNWWIEESTTVFTALGLNIDNYIALDSSTTPRALVF